MKGDLTAFQKAKRLPDFELRILGFSFPIRIPQFQWPARAREWKLLMVSAGNVLASGPGKASKVLTSIWLAKSEARARS
jgi:hypothetical protein